LTSPVIQALYDSGYELHYLLKSAYRTVIQSDSRIHSIWSYDSKLSDTIRLLRAENFDYVVDLHNNMRSLMVRLSLGQPAYVLRKSRIRDFLMIRFKAFRNPRPHIVHRFMDTALPLISFDSKTDFQPDFRIDPAIEGQQTIEGAYISVSIATAFPTKDIPVETLAGLINSMPGHHFVLLGADKDVPLANKLVNRLTHRNYSSFVGRLGLHASADIIRNSKALVTGDSGLMHIAAALNTPVIALFGSTHPVLGYTPYYNKPTPHHIIQNETLSCRPCSRQGRKSCPKGHFKCMNDLSIDEIRLKVEQLVGP